MESSSTQLAKSSELLLGFSAKGYHDRVQGVLLAQSLLYREVLILTENLDVLLEKEPSVFALDKAKKIAALHNRLQTMLQTMNTIQSRIDRITSFLEAEAKSTDQKSTFSQYFGANMFLKPERVNIVLDSENHVNFKSLQKLVKDLLGEFT